MQTWLSELPGLLGNKESMDAFLLSAETNLASRRNDVLRLLVTHSATQLKEGGERLLIESLSSTQQDERLLAIVQLSTLTGKTLGFHPRKARRNLFRNGESFLSKKSHVHPNPTNPRHILSASTMNHSSLWSNNRLRQWLFVTPLSLVLLGVYFCVVVETFAQDDPFGGGGVTTIQSAPSGGAMMVGPTA